MVSVKQPSIALALVVMSVWAVPSTAQTLFDLIETCEQAGQNPDRQDVSVALSDLRSRKYIGQDEVIERGEQCLSKISEEPIKFLYGEGFLSATAYAERKQQLEAEALKEEVAEEAEAERRQAYRAKVVARQCELIDEYIALGMTLPALEATEQARRSNAIRQTVVECDAWLLDDERAALTNPVCSDLFLDIGLPEDRDVGAGASVTATERELEAILDQLEIIRSSNKLPEDYWQDQQEQTLAEFRETKEELGCEQLVEHGD